MSIKKHASSLHTLKQVLTSFQINTHLFRLAGKGMLCLECWCDSMVVTSKALNGQSGHDRFFSRLWTRFTWVCNERKENSCVFMFNFMWEDAYIILIKIVEFSCLISCGRMHTLSYLQIVELSCLISCGRMHYLIYE